MVARPVLPAPPGRDVKGTIGAKLGWMANSEWFSIPMSAGIRRRESPASSPRVAASYSLLAIRQLRRRQHQFGTQAADRRGAEHELAAIELRQLHHDREAEARPGLGLVEAPAPIAHL